MTHNQIIVTSFDHPNSFIQTNPKTFTSIYQITPRKYRFADQNHIGHGHSRIHWDCNCTNVCFLQLKTGMKTGIKSHNIKQKIYVKHKIMQHWSITSGVNLIDVSPPLHNSHCFTRTLDEIALLPRWTVVNLIIDAFSRTCLCGIWAKSCLLFS
jgi:hypothetical protein